MGGQALSALIGAAIRLLDDSVPSSGCLYVGPMLLTVLQVCGGMVSESLPHILVAILRRLGSERHAMLRMVRAILL
jgi:hypothetical protein